MDGKGKTELNEIAVDEILEAFKVGEISRDSAHMQLRNMLYENLGFAKIDHDRKRRTGFPEVVFGQGKTTKQVTSIAAAISACGDNVLITKVSKEAEKALKKDYPNCEVYEQARIVFIRNSTVQDLGTAIAVVTAGTADIPIAEEAAVTAEIMGNRVERVYDCGVAGLHRILDQLDVFSRVNVAIVVAGMEGALSSVVTGLVDVPVIGVPTSVGYGTNLNGLVTAMAMLSSCASGLGVVNVDNGFGAAFLAGSITREIYKQVHRTTVST